MLASPSSDTVSKRQECTSSLTTNRKKRRPAGTPDPDAEVVSLSPKTLLESDRYVCEICNQGFRRDQNLQMHRRRHKVPWKLLKKEKAATTAVTRKRVYVCPEPSCLHHDPAHALGDLVGIKKHYRRKHGGQRQWVCSRCSKGYAVQSDYKAHVKTCGTRGHTCDCGRVFSRVESFIEHQDTCQAGRPLAIKPLLQFLELQFLPQPANSLSSTLSLSMQDPPVNIVTKLCLSLGPVTNCSVQAHIGMDKQLEHLTEEKVMADKERESARKDVEAAERELIEARKMREQAQMELRNALAFREATMKMLVHVTCHSCRKGFRMVTTVLGDDKSLM
ncbi:hypothetical protein LUZ61_006703 [Rhynchospora tenuis]|uniref:C2H2-type domain-containing protein n=1 Tax=Rhynchospora tenuis TaxID=198213 RepID=A0AAD5ZS45_9POAL|nr:hypothetical protein LUZ61_006703 [Rhynchospora tenuis]